MLCGGCCAAILSVNAVTIRSPQIRRENTPSEYYGYSLRALWVRNERLSLDFTKPVLDCHYLLFSDNGGRAAAAFDQAAEGVRKAAEAEADGNRHKA